MRIQEHLMQLGLPTYMETIYVPVPGSNQREFGIAKQMPTQIGWIYAISTYVDGVTPENIPLISLANSTNLYVRFKDGMSAFINDKRLSDLVTFNANQGIIFDDAWECSIPGSIDLSQSKILNPTGIVGDPTTGTMIALNLYYIDWTSYEWMCDQKYLKPMRRAANPNK